MAFMNPVLDEWLSLLAAVGIRDAALLSENHDPRHFGDADVRLERGPMLLRLLRRRGEDFLEVASASLPEESFAWEDVCIAFGWRTIDEVLGWTSPLPISEVLSEVARRENELMTAFKPEHAVSTRDAISEAARRRGDAFLKKLSRLADEYDKDQKR